MRSELVLAVDFGGTKVEAALVDSDGVVLAESRIRCLTGSERSAEQLAGQVRSVVRESLSTMPHDRQLRGIGIGSAGPIDVERGLVSPVNLPVWRGFALRELVAETAGAAGHPVAAVLRLDGTCIALAEHWIGAAVGRETVLGMIVSTGIGGGVIVGGRLATGSSGNAGHIGQVEVAGFTTEHGECTLEEIASGPSTVAWARAHGWEGETGEDLALAYAAADPIAIRAIQRSASAIGRAIASLATVLDLEVVVIGGGFSRVSADLLPLIRASVERHARFDYVRRVVVLATGLDSDGPLVGAAALIWRGTVGGAEQSSKGRT